MSEDRAGAARAWLVACLRALGARRAPPAPPRELDWPVVVDIAAAEDVSPALAHALGAAGWAGVPSSARRRLTEDLAASRARHLLMTRAAGPVLRSCATEGVDVIVLKGPTLAETLYPDPGLRPCSDLDLLVRPADRFRVDAALRGLGHRRVADQHSWDFDVAYDGATVYETPGGVRIDLHWALLTEPRFVWNAGEREIWERSEAITVAGEPARGLGREDLVLYLAAHLAVHHTLAGLRRYWEVSLLLERWAGALDWDSLLARAVRWRVRRALFFVLREARARFAAPVPAGALAALRPTGARAGLLDAIVRRSDDARRLRLEHLVTLLLVDRGRDVCAALRRAVWPSAGWMRARYGIATASRPALYRAHARRLGSVVGGAAGALYTVARSSLAETRAGA
jgi:hypothetical protein